MQSLLLLAYCYSQFGAGALVANKEWADVYLTFDPNFEEEQV